MRSSRTTASAPRQGDQRKPAHTDRDPARPEVFLKLKHKVVQEQQARCWQLQTACLWVLLRPSA